MTGPSQSMTPNLLLRALSPDDYARLQPHLQRGDGERGKMLIERETPITHVHFPESGIASIVAVAPDGERTEVGIFGRDGMSGIAVLLGADRSPHETFIQVNGGTLLALRVERLLEAVASSASLRTALLRFVQVSSVQMAHSAVSNAHHSVEERLARWLLMCHDRSDGDEINITHEFLGMMLAVRRSSVTISIHMLEGGRMIRARRGRIAILDRPALEDLAGDAYGVPEAEYRRLIGPFGKSAPS